MDEFQQLIIHISTLADKHRHKPVVVGLLDDAARLVAAAAASLELATMVEEPSEQTSGDGG